MATSVTSLQQALILSHEYRVLIVESLKESPTGEISPVRISRTSGVAPTDLHYHFKRLVRGGVIEPTREVPRRGAVEHFYRLSSAFRDTMPAEVALDALAELLMGSDGDPDGDRVRAIVRGTGRSVSAAEPAVSAQPVVPKPAASHGMAFDAEKLRQMRCAPLERRCVCPEPVSSGEGSCLYCSKAIEETVMG